MDRGREILSIVTASSDNLSGFLQKLFGARLSMLDLNLTGDRRVTSWKGVQMKRIFLLFLLVAGLCIYGCSSDSDDDYSYYEELTESYETLTVAGLWDAMEDEEDYQGSYILLYGVLYDVDVDDYQVTLIDSSTSKTVDCEFDSDIDLTELQDVLDNNDSTDDLDIVTIGGVAYYSSDSSEYPYLDSCDYFYVNEDQ